MQIITIATDGTLRLELTAEEAKAIRDDLAAVRTRTGEASADLIRYVDSLYGERPTPTFPGGGI